MRIAGLPRDEDQHRQRLGIVREARQGSKDRRLRTPQLGSPSVHAHIASDVCASSPIDTLGVGRSRGRHNPLYYCQASSFREDGQRRGMCGSNMGRRKA